MGDKLPGILQKAQDGHPQRNDLNGGDAANDGPRKAFACSICAKGFSRRSDLARHGKASELSTFSLALTNARTNSQRG
jgi:hypothetical protein